MARPRMGEAGAAVRQVTPAPSGVRPARGARVARLASVARVVEEAPRGQAARAVRLAPVVEGAPRGWAAPEVQEAPAVRAAPEVRRKQGFPERRVTLELARWAPCRPAAPRRPEIILMAWPTASVMASGRM